ncbi:Uncharacterised protein [Mycobacteroides abscessus]|nr:Uncharacterised protein [Mycobacteroides abscessus]
MEASSHRGSSAAAEASHARTRAASWPSTRSATALAAGSDSGTSGSKRVWRPRPTVRHGRSLPRRSAAST